MQVLSVEKEIKKLLKNGPISSDNNLLTKLVPLYIRHEQEQKNACKPQNSMAICRSFAAMCERGSDLEWAKVVKRLSQLHPDLIELVGVTGGIPVETGRRLAVHPKDMQERLLQEALRLSGGNRSTVVSYIPRVRNVERRASAPTSTQHPVEVDSAKSDNQCTKRDTRAPTDREQESDTVFLEALRTMTHTLRVFEGARDTSLRQLNSWTGHKTVYSGKNY